MTVIENHRLLRKLSAWAADLPVVGPAWSKMLQRPKELERFVKFALVGILGMIVDFAVLNVLKLLFESMGLGEGMASGLQAHEIQLIAANTISFSVAVLSNFTWNRLWTFPESRQQPLGRQLAQYALVNVVGLGINTLLLVLLDQYLFQQFVSERLSYNLAKVIAIGVVLFWNFGINRVWTYRDIE